MTFFRANANSVLPSPPKSGSASGSKSGARSGSRSGGRRRLITGLDIGTTKVCALIAEADPDGSIGVLGVGSAPSRGVRHGMVTDINNTVDAIGKAMTQAYELARVMPTELYVGLAGEHISGYNAEAMVEVAHPNVGVDERDVRGVVGRALKMSMPADIEVIYHVVREFVVNGNSGIHNPLGLFGSRLEVKIHVVTASTAAVNNILRCVKKAGHKSSNIVLQSIASSLATLTPQDRELGVAVIDIGGGTCDVSIFGEGTLQFVSEIPVGGDRITQDIAAMLRISPHAAENLKKKFGHADARMISMDETIDLPNPMKGGPRRICYNRRELAAIIEAQVEDIFIKVRDVLDRSGYRNRLYAGVALTGGTALLEGIVDVGSRILDMPGKTRVVMPQGLFGMAEIVRSPIYSTAVGLVRWAVEEGPGYQRESWFKRKIKEVIDIYV